MKFKLKKQIISSFQYLTLRRLRRVLQEANKNRLTEFPMTCEETGITLQNQGKMLTLLFYYQFKQSVTILILVIFQNPRIFM